MTERPDPLESALRSAWNQGEPVVDEPIVLPANPDAPVPYAVTADDTARKGTRKGEPALDSSVLDLLAAIRDALTVPRPAPAPDFTGVMERRRQREQLIADRATAIRIAAAVALDLPHRHLADALGYLTQTIRDNTDAWPVEYEVRQDAADGGEQA
ncbi:hypothetical protein [Streptomyces sp. NPDC008139]|uniref:hypothetical protein n=1 Tax=Streptomyces sp. NPDC008139 TaxID=3364814 RepID=UPI0036F17005